MNDTPSPTNWNPQPEPETEAPAQQLPNKFQQLLKSRKFWAAIAGLLLILAKGLRPDFPVSEEQVTAAVALIATYILGTALDKPATTP